MATTRCSRRAVRTRKSRFLKSSIIFDRSIPGSSCAAWPFDLSLVVGTLAEQVRRFS
ncbi:MAG: hypothetical protein IPM88_05910 [Nitrospira sp.]|nr:hypothetical protein [Nitrospira sp.]